MPIHFFSEEISFELKKQEQIADWLTLVLEKEGYDVDNINYIFCSDKYLLKINQDYLNHDTYTDIITFDLSEKPRTLSADIFISIERVAENANNLAIKVEDELSRVLAHGALHLVGYKDHTEEEKVEMRQKEDYCISLRSF